MLPPIPGGWKTGKLRNRVCILFVSDVLLILEHPGLHIQSISISSSSHVIGGGTCFWCIIVDHCIPLYTRQCHNVLLRSRATYMSLATPPVSWESGYSRKPEVLDLRLERASRAQQLAGQAQVEYHVAGSWSLQFTVLVDWLRLSLYYRNMQETWKHVVSQCMARYVMSAQIRCWTSHAMTLQILLLNVHFLHHFRRQDPTPLLLVQILNTWDHVHSNLGMKFLNQSHLCISWHLLVYPPV